MANIEKVTIELIGGALLTIRQDGDIVEITADTDATYGVVQRRLNVDGPVLGLRFASSRARRRNGYFSLDEER